MADVQHGDWVVAAADRVVAEAEARGAGGPLVCASGISPSGPVHLGNLREIMVPHFVADELRRRGLDCRHILSWDDYDRLRRVPAGFPDSFAEQIGRPLSAVPDPCGEHASWAEHFKEPLRAATAELGVELTEISQTGQYTSGAYRERITHAMRERARIDAVLGRHRTAEPQAQPAAADYYPYRPYCAACGRDTTTVESFDPVTTATAYRCACGHRDLIRTAEADGGKLVWKVDWPMRWAHEGVLFETGGVDHSSPGSSYAVGSQLVREVFGGRPPVYLGFSFVGTGGTAKLSSSAGTAPTPGEALRILEPALLRWLYGRRQPRQAITVAFGQEVLRLYDEWDALGRKVAAGTAGPAEAAARERSVGTAAGPLPATEHPLPFGVLASVADLTGGDPEQTLRILREVSTEQPPDSLEQVRPRLDRARAWVDGHLPVAERTRVRSGPDRDRLAALTPGQRAALALLLDGLPEHWSLDGLTALLYGIPKRLAGLSPDAPATPELKRAQRELFVLLYELLVGRDTGPRLPTLLLVLGPERIGELLGSDRATSRQ